MKKMQASQLPQRMWQWLGGQASYSLAAFVLAGLVASGIWQTYTAKRWDLHREVVSEALVQTQRLAWAATVAPADDPIARSALLESKQRLAQIFSVLLNGGTLDQSTIAPLSGSLQVEFAEAARWWFRIERAATAMLALPSDTAQGPRISSLSDAVEQFVTSYQTWADPQRADLPPLALETSILVERLSHLLNAQNMSAVARNRLGTPTQIPVLLARIQQNVETMLNPEPAKAVKAAQGKDRERLLSLRSDLAVLVKQASGIQERLPKLSEGIDSGRTIAIETEQLRRQLSVLFKKMDDREAPLRWLLIVLELLALGLIGLARAQHLLRLEKEHAETVQQHAIQLLNAQSGQDATLEAKREGAEAALRGVLAALQQTAESTQKATEQAGASIQMQAQLLIDAGKAVLQLAHAFHNVSTQATAAAKTALLSRQDVNQGQTKVVDTVKQWELLREDIQKTASGLRRTGEASRALGEAVNSLPPEMAGELTPLLDQTREALREAVAGLAAGTQHIREGQQQTTNLVGMLSSHETAWLQMLNNVEQCAGSAANQAEGALSLAKTLSRSGQQTIQQLTHSNKLLQTPQPPTA